MNLLADHKKVSDGIGHNEMGGREWGWFSVEELGRASLGLNYNDPRNPRSVRSIRDVVRRDGDGWTGMLYLRDLPMFEFRLDRATKNEEPRTGN